MRIQAKFSVVVLAFGLVLVLSGCGGGTGQANKLPGSWHLKQEQVSGKLQEADEKESYAFTADGTFSHSLDKQKDGKNVKMDTGKWEVKDDKLVLTNPSGKSHSFKIVIADGQFTIDTSDDEKQIYARD